MLPSLPSHTKKTLTVTYLTSSLYLPRSALAPKRYALSLGNTLPTIPPSAGVLGLLGISTFSLCGTLSHFSTPSTDGSTKPSFALLGSITPELSPLSVNRVDTSCPDEDVPGVGLGMLPECLVSTSASPCDFGFGFLDSVGQLDPWLVKVSVPLRFSAWSGVWVVSCSPEEVTHSVLVLLFSFEFCKTHRRRIILSEIKCMYKVLKEVEHGLRGGIPTSQNDKSFPPELFKTKYFYKVSHRNPWYNPKLTRTTLSRGTFCKVIIFLNDRNTRTKNLYKNTIK